MKHFWKGNTGSALIWSVFIIVILMTLSAVVFAGMTVYSKYQDCETEVQRAAIITVDTNMLNANVRDLVLEVPTESAEESFYASLNEVGWTLKDGCWNRYEDGKAVYCLKDMSVVVDGKTVNISATMVIPLPWKIGDIGKVSIPMKVRSSVLYIE
jgi:archaellum component FlaF (FlaF/FlaG flagellin family)